MKMNSRGVTLTLGSGTELVARFCPRSNLPILSVTTDAVERNFWSEAFAYTAADTVAFGKHENIFQPSNANLSASQKETLLWHQRLSHASMSWIQLLMRDRCWMKDYHSPSALHQGPFIPCKEPRGPTCDISCLKCSACLTAKAHVRSPTANRPVKTYSQEKIDRFTTKINGEKTKRS